MSEIAKDNFGIFYLLGDMPEPKGFKNAIELEKALTQPSGMDDVLVGIQFDDNMASE